MDELTPTQKEILAMFRSDRLCAACKGPIEVDRDIPQCAECERKAHLRTHIDWIKTGAMNMEIMFGLRNAPQHKKQVSMSKQKASKKKTRKKVAKKTAKKARKSTKRKASK